MDSSGASEAEGGESAPAPGSGGWRILIVDDEAVFARAIATTLTRAGHSPLVATTVAEARSILKEHAARPPEVVLLDMRLPDGDGLELLSKLIEQEPAPTVLVMTAYGDVGQAVKAMQAGAADYLKKPIDLEELLITLDKAMQSERLRVRLRYSRTRESRSESHGQLIGDSRAIRDVRTQIDNVAAVGGDRPPNVLILGETGTGKDVVARLVHRRGPRRDRPFVHVDCASLPGEIMEAELFGHARGAFTSAHAARAGLIEAAEDGTVFLDEIGELPLDMQSKLLNVLERRQVRRVGSTREVPVPARFIAATNRDLPAMVARGAFRDDLFYRLNVLGIALPPLRQHREDVPLLAHHFLEATSRSYGRPTPRVEDAALAALAEYAWPGNVRELKNVIERAALLAGPEGIAAASFAFSAPARPSAPSPRMPVAASGAGPVRNLLDAERDLIEAALIETNGNASLAARQLGITRMALRYRAEKYGLRPDDYRRRYDEPTNH